METVKFRGLINHGLTALAERFPDQINTAGSLIRSHPNILVLAPAAIFLTQAYRFTRKISQRDYKHAALHALFMVFSSKSILDGLGLRKIIIEKRVSSVDLSPEEMAAFKVRILEAINKARADGTLSNSDF
ncbi:hypothetical protein A3A46_01125 [Candidatus Roizmanbacteria bacterium RIFCSPLOWO2_01_FULL_37_13]|nr:MAG: hypothetical protein A3A46_01125 [Candidatus Roizmanbacteria bacterium RIFCSPLOWO2_01_FULL_37_13]